MAVDPAAVAAEVAGVGQGEEQERREQLAPLHALLVRLHGPAPLVGPEVRGLPQQARRDFGGKTISQSQEQCALWPEGDRSMFSAIVDSQNHAFSPKIGPVPAAHARERNWPVRVSTLIFSPWLRYSGTCTTRPVSSVAGLVRAVAERR